ncbi:unnamed protein product [Urochloa humidicola]
MPVSTPGPAATPKCMATHRSFTLSPPTPGSSPSPVSSTPVSPTVGRSKEQRWWNDSPPSGKSGGGAPTFVEVLLLGMRPVSAPQALSSGDACPATALQAPVLANRMASAGAVASPWATPRIVLVTVGRSRSKAAQVPDADGWSKVKGRHRQCRERVGWALRPHRPVPTDLRGKCFNCFSLEHRAATCKSMTRCFRCQALGHRPLGIAPQWPPSRGATTPTASMAAEDRCGWKRDPSRYLSRAEGGAGIFA